MPSPTREPVSPGVASAPVLRVDRVLCTGHGACASLLPQHVRLDEWGYPLVDHPRVDEREAAIAMTLCPARALWVDRPRERP